MATQSQKQKALTDLMSGVGILIKSEDIKKRMLESYFILYEDIMGYNLTEKEKLGLSKLMS
jgi:hypothetical protein